LDLRRQGDQEEEPGHGRGASCEGGTRWGRDNCGSLNGIWLTVPVIPIDTGVKLYPTGASARAATHLADHQSRLGLRLAC
jgi:hypothetical protein